jgi:L-threonylcarbamoyladenylate synthase
MISADAIAKVLDAMEAEDSNNSSVLKAPGQLAVHYAPRTPAYRFAPRDRPKLNLANAAILEPTLDPSAYARNLYARLRMLDTQNLEAIYIELPPDTPEWAAVRDRLMRATRPLP